MGKYLIRIDPGFMADSFHLAPDIASVQGPAVSRDEYHAGYNIHFSCVRLKEPAQSIGQEYGPYLSFAVHLCNLLIHRVHCDVIELRYSDSGGTYGLKQKGQPLIPFTAGNIHKPFIFLPGKLPLPGAKYPLLYLY